jgi:hypothetical protein
MCRIGNTIAIVCVALVTGILISHVKLIINKIIPIKINCLQTLDSLA